jgi:hypothetical protein
MGNTPIYRFGYIEPNQDLSENIDLDELRFKAIENQMYNLYQIFKNGIIEEDPSVPSWRIQTYSNEFKLTKITITSGKGFVSYKAGNTITSKDVTLPTIPSTVGISKVYVYAYENANTAVTGDVDFIASLTQINDTVNYISLGYLEINVASNLISLFETNRQDITLFSTLSYLIKNHKHIGGTGNPSPIDLSYEVKNQITSENISSVDAAKITTGILDSSRLPTISHTSLEDKGNLTHDQLETALLAVVNNDANDKMSDLSIANRLQMLIALKKSGGVGFTFIDSTQINTLTYVPGIYPNTSANSSTGNSANFKQTSSVPSQYTLATIYDAAPNASGSGISGSVTSSSFVGDKSFVVQNDFLQAKTVASSLGSTTNTFFNNISISGSATTGSFTIDTPLNYLTLSQPVSSIFDTTGSWDTGLVFTTSYAANKVKVDTSLYAYTLFNQPISLDFDSKVGFGFSAGLGETGAALGKIYMFLVVGNGNTDPGLQYDQKIDFAPNTGTGSSTIYITPATSVKIFDDTTYGYIGSTATYSSVNLSDFGNSSLKSSVLGFGFYFSTDQGWNAEKQTKFELLTPTDAQINVSGNDDSLVLARRNSTDQTSSVFVWNDIYRYKNANFLMRFDSGDSNTQYNQIQYNIDIPTGTKYTIQSRSNVNSDLFYNLKTVSETDVIIATPNISSSTGRYFDVLFSLYSNEFQSLAPTVNNLRINYSTVGSATTRTYDRNLTDTTNQKFGWVSDVYYNKNAGYGNTNPDDTNYLKIYDTSNVGNWVYLRNNNLISAANNVIETTVEDGIDAGTLRNYLTPNQIFLKSTNYGLDTPTDYQSLFTGGNIICDSKNDRIIMTDINGLFTKVIQGNIRLKLTSRDFVALSASFNPSTRKIFIAFSQNISFVDLTKIYITYDNISVRGDDTRLSGDYLEPIFDSSASYVFTINDTVEGIALNAAISNSLTKKVRLDKGCFTNSGNSLNTNSALSATIPTSTVSTTNRTEQFVAGISTSITGTSTVTTGLPTTTNVVNSVTDYNGDGIVSTTTMYGPNSQADDVILDLLQGPIYFANIYNPVSVQYDETNSLIVIAQPHSNSVLCYNDNTDLTLKWAITSDIVKYYDNKLGSAYLLANGNVLLGSPSLDTTDTGKLQVYNISNGYIETKLTFNNDVVKALPGPATDYSNFYVLTDDVINFGANSRLHLVNNSGTILSTWGDNNELFHPKGMRIISNDNILVSE